MLRVSIVCLLLAATAVAQDQKPSKAERAQFRKLAKVWVEYARACRLGGHKTEGGWAIGRAEKADPAAKDLARLKGELEGL
ncbi:MAG: hypothetical protein OER88_03605, partial [Planctomycetota bacterium]|nr:hypothetical protein [Planctomycetota bacterium]